MGIVTQFNPSSASGKRNFVITSGIALIGLSAAASGVPLPIDVAGSIFTSSTAAATANTAAITNPTFWSSALDLCTTHGSNIINGTSYLGGGVYDALSNIDWTPTPA